MKLYTYFRSSAAYRVRIALNLKGLDYEPIPVHLTRDGGQHRQAGYAACNPQKLVPALGDGDGVITQSLAIIEYLDETRPGMPLLPSDPAARGRVRAISQAIACDIHPLNNLRVLQYLTGNLGLDEAAKTAWYRHWIAEGMAGVEGLLANHPRTGLYCHGDTPTMADCCLVPQVFNAQRFNCDLTAYPTAVAIVERCLALPPFQQAAPAAQPDAE